MLIKDFNIVVVFLQMQVSKIEMLVEKKGLLKRFVNFK